MAYPSRRHRPPTDEVPNLPFIVPGAYLVRPNDLTVDDVYDELKYAGVLLIRRFLAHKPRSDYLLVFDRKKLLEHCRIELEERETPAGSWAELVQKTQAEPVTPVQPTPAEVVVAEREKAEIPVEASAPEVALGKKTRPGRHARKMLKALVEASTEVAPAPESETTAEAVAVPPVKMIVPPPKPVKPTSIPLGSNLLLRGSGPSHPLFRLRPFRVTDVMDVDESRSSPGLVPTPHLVVYHPPRPGFVPSAPGVRNKANDTKALAHVEKCHKWITEVIKNLVTCGLLPSASVCRVSVAQADASRLSRANLTAMQCRFSDDTPMPVRNAVYAILRSTTWFHSLAKDTLPVEGEELYLVRCWWRQVPTSAE
jgi:hypothetical protein